MLLSFERLIDTYWPSRQTNSLFQVIDDVCRVSTLWPNEDIKMVWGIVIISLQFFIPFLILIICYGQIIWVLTRRINTDLMKNKSVLKDSESCNDREKNTNIATQVRDTGRDMFQVARRNTIKTLLIVGFCFIICWSQNQIMYFMYNCGIHFNFNGTYIQFTVLMVFVNCTVNPFIYLIKYKDYQEALKVFFDCNRNQGSKSTSNSSIMSIADVASLSTTLGYDHSDNTHRK